MLLSVFVFHSLTFLSLFVLGSVFSQAMKKWVQGSSDQVSLRGRQRLSHCFSKFMHASISILPQVLHSQTSLTCVL